MKRCAENPTNAEYSLCGNSWDSPDDPMCNSEAFKFAMPGETVTCADCKNVIRELRESYPRGYKRIA